MTASGAPKVKAADATVARVGGRFELRFQRWYPHPTSRVWSALTEPDELAGWLAAAALDLTVGGEVMLHWLNVDEGDQVLLHGVITALEPSRLLEYETDLHGGLRWELAEEADGAALTLTNVSPTDGDHLAQTLAGWHLHLDHLEDALAGEPVAWGDWSPTTRALGSGLSWNDHWQRYTSRAR